MKKGFIEKELYDKICAVVPIVCVDIVVVSEKKFLLGKRKNNPAKGQWFFPGGRMYKNETVERAAIRKAREEIGLSLKKKDLEILGFGETIFKEGRGVDKNRHTVNIVFKVATRSKRFHFDKTQHAQLRWFDSVHPKWNPYVKFFLKKAGF